MAAVVGLATRATLKVDEALCACDTNAAAAAAGVMAADEEELDETVGSGAI